MQGLTPFGQTAGYNLMLSQRLRNQDQALNNGTVPGGLAYMLNQGVNAYLQAKDAGQRQAADQTYMDALTKPQAPAGGGMDYQQPNAPKMQPGVDAAIGRLSELKGNPYAGRLTQMLAMQKMQQEAQAAEAEQRFRQQLYRDQMNNQARVNAAAAGRSSVNVNTGNSGPQFGTIPAGYMMVQDPQSGAYQMVPVPGSPAETAATRETETAANKQESTARSAGVVLEDIGRFKEKIKRQPWYSPVTGLGGAILSNIPGTGAFDAARIGDTIRANIGFDRLQQMRDESPTGGALGAINQSELQFLQSVLGSLDQAQNEEQLLYNLGRLDTIYRDILRKAQAYPNAERYGFGGGGDIGNGITAMPGQPAGNAGAPSAAPLGSREQPWPISGPDDPRLENYAIGDHVRLPDGSIMVIQE